MSIITENGIDTLNYVTKDLDNLDDLGIYLAKETDIKIYNISWKMQLSKKRF